MRKNEKGFALITNATSEMGRAFAYQLAGQGYDLVLVGRNENVLQLVADVCENVSAVKSVIFSIDMAHPDAVNQLIHFLEKTQLTIDVFINIAGFDPFGHFTACEIAQETQMLHKHMISAFNLIHCLLPGMIQRKFGFILNVSSLYAFLPLPSKSVYTAMKSFLISFSNSLREELAGSGVSVTALCPGFLLRTCPRSTDRKQQEKSAGMTVDEIAYLGCQALWAKKSICVPGFSNKICFFMMRYLPSSALFYINRIFNHHGNV
jgi:short-subunit dehydrogenase